MEITAHLKQILPEFGFDPDAYNISVFGSGLIHTTLVLKDQDEKPRFIAQKVNQNVFKKPYDISHNLECLGDFLKNHHPGYLLPLPLKTIHKTDYAEWGDGYYRLIPFVAGTHAIDICTDPDQAYEAALQFGKFTACFHGMDVSVLKDTIPSFHNLSFRWQQFQDALTNGDASRIAECRQEIKELQEKSDIVSTYHKIVSEDSFRLRVTHHDTKISNVLFDEQGKGICVIDLDTVMKGYYISDLGDMFRTYLCPIHEGSDDYASIHVREAFREAIVEGYQEHMSDLLTETEKRMLLYSGEFMIYMQALRFLTDHLNLDVYYGASYPGQNLVRARNQLTLLSAFQQENE